ncbi:MAG: molecular chaperone TorD family protein, partial [Firmicutes bacterium]|nr:molecular chaperone TorD family protein [Bacillota bacterium]
MTDRQFSTFYSRISDFFLDLDAWRISAAALGIRSELTQIEYDDLLKGTNAHIYVPLWTSCAKSGTKLLNSEVTLEVIKFYKACGWAPHCCDGNPADYLGEELAFLAYLYGCRADDPGSFSDEPEQFAGRYLGDTVKAFCEALNAESVKTWISALARVELDQLSVLLQKAFKGELSVDADASPRPGAYRRMPAIPVEPARQVRIANVNDCGSKCQMLATVQENCLLGTEPEKT